MTDPWNINDSDIGSEYLRKSRTKKYFCIHGISLTEKCKECFNAAGRRAGCEACIQKDMQIDQLKDTAAILERSLRDQILDNERLRQAICEWSRLVPLHYAAMSHKEIERTRKAAEKLHEIAREEANL